MIKVALWPSLALALLLGVASSQTLSLNTAVRSFTPVSGSPWVADIWAYTDASNREFALVCRGNQGLSIYEITNPQSPVFASSVPATGSDLKDVKVFQDHAFCVQQSGSTLVINISDPYNPQVVSSAIPSGHNGTVDASTGRFYLTRNGSSPFDMRIYDISTPSNPVFLSSWRPTNENTHDCYVEDGIAYVSALFSGTAGTHIVDVSNPLNPTTISIVPSGNVSHNCWLHTTPGGAKILGTTNETAGGHLKLWDVTDPQNTPLLSEYMTSPSISIHNVQFVDRYAYISYYADYLRILDVGNPSHPVEVGIFDPNANNIGAGTFDGAWGAALVKRLPNGDYRFLVTESFATPTGFWVVDFSPPATLDMDLSTTGAGDFSLQVGGADPGAEIFNLISTTTGQNLGSGPLVGLQGDAIFFLGFPLGTAPFHVSADPAGNYSFAMGPGSVPPGLSIDLVSASLVSGQWIASQLGRVSF